VKGLKECGRFAHANKRPQVRPLVALHASFTVSDQTVAEAGHLAREFSIPVHVHVAEDMADTLDAHKRGYEGALHRLARLDALPPGSILAHGVDLDDPIAHLADTNGFWLVQNPRSNKNNRVGWPYALGASSRVALGTDGFPSDMQAEWLACADGMIENSDRRAAEDPEQLARRRAGGHRLATERFGETFSAVPVPGAAADLAVYEVPGVAPVAVNATLEDVDLYRTHRKTQPGLSRPRHVLCAGRLVVKDGRLLTGDEAAIRADAETQAARLWKRMAEVA
jgi:cytosine/adenosine deaminase-related metal-dependent hydrolase